MESEIGPVRRFGGESEPRLRSRGAVDGGEQKFQIAQLDDQVACREQVVSLLGRDQEIGDVQLHERIENPLLPGSSQHAGR